MTPAQAPASGSGEGGAVTAGLIAHLPQGLTDLCSWPSYLSPGTGRFVGSHLHPRDAIFCLMGMRPSLS